MISILSKNGLGNIMGDFFTHASGQPASKLCFFSSFSWTFLLTKIEKNHYVGVATLPSGLQRLQPMLSMVVVHDANGVVGDEAADAALVDDDLGSILRNRFCRNLRKKNLLRVKYKF
jgi:hypothetical protein